MFSATKISSRILGARMYSSSASPFKQITVIGGGQMGAGITQVAATHNHSVTLVDVTEEALARGKGYMAKSLKRIAKKKFSNNESAQTQFVEDVLARITLSTNAQESVRSSNLIIEAIVENIKVKQDLFSALVRDAPRDAVFASNTSSLPIREISAPLSEQEKSRFVGLHFFNPVPQMKLVEVVRAEQAEQSVVDSAVQFVKCIGKEPAVCKDTPGFIVNRLLLPYMMESIRLLERGVAEAKDIDTAMKLGAGYPMGPFELLDYVGLDTVKFIVDGWHANGGDGLKGEKQFESSKILDDLVKAGHLGAKTGRGFYDYSK